VRDGGVFIGVISWPRGQGNQMNHRDLRGDHIGDGIGFVGISWKG
jgi:hypothetical protein